MIYLIDIDGTLAETSGADYNNSKPLENRIKKINELYKQGHIIKIFTGRGMSTGVDWTEVTMNQLKEWNLNYNELIMNTKPHCHCIVDDIAVSPNKFFNDNYNKE